MLAQLQQQYNRSSFRISNQTTLCYFTCSYDFGLLLVRRSKPDQCPCVHAWHEQKSIHLQTLDVLYKARSAGDSVSQLTARSPGPQDKASDFRGGLEGVYFGLLLHTRVELVRLVSDGQPELRASKRARCYTGTASGRSRGT